MIHVLLLPTRTEPTLDYNRSVTILGEPFRIYISPADEQQAESTPTEALVNWRTEHGSTQILKPHALNLWHKVSQISNQERRADDRDSVCSVR